MQRPRDRRCREGQYVDLGRCLLDAFFELDPKLLLFVDDQQPKVEELHIRRSQSMRADEDIDLSISQFLERFVLLCTGFKATDFGDLEREFSHPSTEGFVVLFGKHRGRHEHGNLVATFDCFEGRPHGDFGFSKAHIAADEPLHRTVRDHVLFGRFDRRQLIGCLLVGKGGFELLLPNRVGLEGDTGLRLALGLELQKLGRHVLDGGLSRLFLASPSLSANLGQFRPRLGAADVSLNKIDIRCRYVEFCSAVELEC